MALPQGIFESFQENPGTDLDDTTGLSVLDTMSSNPMMAKILAKNKKIMESSAMAVPEQNNQVEHEDRPVQKQQSRRQPLNEEFYNEGDEREPEQQSMEDLLKKFKGVGKKTNEQKIVPQQQTYSAPAQQLSGGIDYTLLNTMIRGAVMEAMATMKGQLLTESKSNVSEAAFMTIGKELRFVDKNGNVYVGKLQKVANVND